MGRDWTQETASDLVRRVYPLLALVRLLQLTGVQANHCVGAVMFLIEGEGKAILYTGDIRGENDSR